MCGLPKNDIDIAENGKSGKSDSLFYDHVLSA